MAIYRARSMLVEAFKWTGGPDQAEDPAWIIAAIRNGRVRFLGRLMIIETTVGTMQAEPGDYIIRIEGADGAIYPCRAALFERLYTPDSNAERHLCEC